MSTGYTHAIQSGEITTLETFALQCARAFGACITMRDAPLSDPIPDQFFPNTKYNEECWQEAFEMLKKVNSMSDEECEDEAEHDYREATELYRHQIAEKELHKQRYQQMLDQVQKWSPLADIQPLKEFMIQQLQASIDFDYSTEYMTLPLKLNAVQWRSQKIEKVHRDISYHAEKIKKEIQRTEDRNKWLKSLRDSLKVEA